MRRVAGGDLLSMLSRGESSLTAVVFRVLCVCLLELSGERCMCLGRIFLPFLADSGGLVFVADVRDVFGDHGAPPMLRGKQPSAVYSTCGMPVRPRADKDRWDMGRCLPCVHVQSPHDWGVLNASLGAGLRR